ncbi:hypothetical protein [Maricaulis maris]|uniref:hypothetical protein n=1 Tax=Maricaulis maris TaxID=74318 RepID=UPI0030C6BDB5
MKNLFRTAALASLCGLAACSTPGYRSLNPSCLEANGQPKYQRDGHQDTTYVIARFAGHSDEDAARLAFFNQAADDLALRYAAPQVSVWGLVGGWSYRHRINAVLHSLHGGNPEAVAQRRLDLAELIEQRNRTTPRADWQTGFLIHALGDSYAHTNPAGEAYGELYGHVFDGHWPDLVGNRRELYIDYIEALFDALEMPTASDRMALSQLKRSLRAVPDGDIEGFRTAILAMRDYYSGTPRLECDALARTLNMRDVSRFLREVEAGFTREPAGS